MIMILILTNRISFLTLAFVFWFNSFGFLPFSPLLSHTRQLWAFGTTQQIHRLVASEAESKGSFFFIVFLFAFFRRRSFFFTQSIESTRGEKERKTEQSMRDGCIVGIDLRVYICICTFGNTHTHNVLKFGHLGGVSSFFTFSSAT